MAFDETSYHRERAMEIARNVGVPVLIEGGRDFDTSPHANRWNYEWWLAKMGLGFESKKVNQVDLLVRAVIPNAKQQRRIKKVVTGGGEYARKTRN